jgi:predicted Zn-dependent protease
MFGTDIKRLTLAIALTVIALAASAQDDNIILRAMNDEMKRSMTELALPGYEKPFFISYTVTDSRELAINASLGALVRSTAFPGRVKDVRVMVGNYDFNDESLDVSNNQVGQLNEINIPIDNDYNGIRRAFWTTTDAVYRAAAKSYKDNVAFLKEQKKELKDVPHRSFAKAPVTKINKLKKPTVVDRQKLEFLAKELSGIFKSYSDIVSSGVFISVIETDNYFINSEGTEIATTDFTVAISANAQVKTDEGEFIFDHISHRVLSLEKLPDAETLRKEVKQMADRLTTLKKTDVFKDSYTGPVLFVGTAAADVFSNSLFSFGESFSASKNITNGYSAADSKLGKKVVDDRFTIKSVPKMKSFNDTELLGSYEVDAEGVVPPDELVLVEGGILKNLFSDRTITKEGQTSNGHGSGPGVISVSANSGVSLDKLKEQLIETAKEEGLEYALIVKHFSAGGVRSVNTYKVSLKDGKEELIRSANVRTMNLKSLKKVLGVSNEQIVRNTEVGRFGSSISLIAPSAILLEEVEVEGARSNPFLDKEVYVENPVKGSN